jgi:ketosteroid isomerase-like protein
MTRWIRFGSALVLVLASARLVAGGNGDAAAVEKAVLEAHHEMVAAADALDAEGFFAFILDTAAGPVIQDGRLFPTRAEALEVVERSFEGVATIERVYESEEVTPISGEAALLTGEGTSTVTLEDGRSFQSPFAVSLVFVLKEEGWRVLHGHYSAPNPR